MSPFSLSAFRYFSKFALLYSNFSFGTEKNLLILSIKPSFSGNFGRMTPLNLFKMYS